jgi:thiamine-phosphate pyrophosphorylase
MIDDTAAFAPRLTAALEAGDVACLLLRTNAHDERASTQIARALVATVQAHGTALLVQGDTRLASYVDADGVHVEGGGDDLAQAIRSMKPSRIVGVGGLASRDDAMLAGESGADYLMFGEAARGRNDPPSLEDRLDRVSWWAEIFQVPCVACAYALDEVETLAAAGAEFVALAEAVWDDPRGPAAAVRDALSALETGGARYQAKGLEPN